MAMFRGSVKVRSVEDEPEGGLKREKFVSFLLVASSPVSQPRLAILCDRNRDHCSFKYSVRYLSPGWP